VINLAPNIRQFIVADTTFANLIADYKNSKSVFTRRPLPADTTFPTAVVSSLITSRIDDLIDENRRVLTYDVIVYDNNDTVTSYANVESAVFRLVTLFHRNRSMPVPSGWRLVDTVANGPFNAATDDFAKVARAVTLSFTIHQP